MRILLVSATDAEIAPFLGALRDASPHDIEVLTTGVGMVAAIVAVWRSLVPGAPWMAGSSRKPLACMAAAIASPLAIGFFSRLVQMLSGRLRRSSNELTLVFDLSYLLLEPFPNATAMFDKAMPRVMQYLEGE